MKKIELKKQKLVDFIAEFKTNRAFKIRIYQNITLVILLSMAIFIIFLFGIELPNVFMNPTHGSPTLNITNTFVLITCIISFIVGLTFCSLSYRELNKMEVENEWGE